MVENAKIWTKVPKILSNLFTIVHQHQLLAILKKKYQKILPAPARGSHTKPRMHPTNQSINFYGGGSKKWQQIWQFPSAGSSPGTLRCAFMWTSLMNMHILIVTKSTTTSAFDGSLMYTSMNHIVVIMLLSIFIHI